MHSPRDLCGVFDDGYIGTGVAQSQKKSVAKNTYCSENGTRETVCISGNPSHTYLYRVQIAGLITYAGTFRG